MPSLLDRAKSCYVTVSRAPVACAVLAGCVSHGGDPTEGPRLAPKSGDWGIVAGMAAITPNFDEGGVAGALELDYFADSQWCVALRHIGDYEDDGNDSSINVTKIGFDWTLSKGRIEPLAGLSAGAAYGESVNESALIGVHVGIRFWRQPRAFLHVLGGYDRFWTRTEDRTEYYREGAFSLVLGIGVLF